MVDTETLERLRKGLRGELIEPGAEGYESARRVFNAMVDRRPALILRAGGPSDVIRGVGFARENGLELSVRGGGHSVAGKAVCDGGLMLDLSAMKGVRVEPHRRRARAEPGSRLSDFDRETQAFRLATTTGIVSDTGLAGLTLGGGIGWLNGKHGLACDNLVSAEVVTADARMLTASAEENDDLFWAIRGGGGNFGVVTSFEYGLHPLQAVLGGLVIHPLSRGSEALRFYHEFSSAVPDEVSTAAALLNGPDGSPVVALAACHCGPLSEAERALAPLRAFGPPAADLIRPMEYVELQSMLDASFPRKRMHYWKAHFIREVTESAAEAMLEGLKSKPSPLTIITLQQIHGAAARVPVGETAFPHRRVQYDLAILSQWEDAAASEDNIRWTRELWERLRPHCEAGVYVNNLGDEGRERVCAAYGRNYDRLSVVKRKYDPTNFFHGNQNIVP